MARWSSSDLQVDGQADWLIHMYEKTVNGIREFGGLPREETAGFIKVKTPLLGEQARVMRFRDILPPGHNAPTGVLDWLD